MKHVNPLSLALFCGLVLTLWAWHTSKVRNAERMALLRAEADSALLVAERYQNVFQMFEMRDSVRRVAIDSMGRALELLRGERLALQQRAAVAQHRSDSLLRVSAAHLPADSVMTDVLMGLRFAFDTVNLALDACVAEATTCQARGDSLEVVLFDTRQTLKKANATVHRLNTTTAELRNVMSTTPFSTHLTRFALAVALGLLVIQHANR